MKEHEKPREGLVVDEHGQPCIHCRRLDRPLPLSEHRDCPYCFGKEADIKTGDHRRFCDYKPGEDPINFGFPDTFGRYAK